jgi:PadR family transcriptional regulator PadR
MPIHNFPMYICPMYSKELIKGTLTPIILGLLEENNRMYGYEITQEVKERTLGKIEITEGALYPTLHKLEADGILKTEEEYIGKRVRKYYSLTKNRSAIAVQRVSEIKDFMATLSLLLNPKHV